MKQNLVKFINSVVWYNICNTCIFLYLLSNHVYCVSIFVANKSSDILEQANNALKRLKNVIKLDGTWDAQLIAIFDVTLMIYRVH